MSTDYVLCRTLGGTRVHIGESVREGVRLCCRPNRTERGLVKTWDYDPVQVTCEICRYSTPTLSAPQTYNRWLAELADLVADARLRVNVYSGRDALACGIDEMWQRGLTPQEALDEMR